MFDHIWYILTICGRFETMQQILPSVAPSQAMMASFFAANAFTRQTGSLQSLPKSLLAAGRHGAHDPASLCKKDDEDASAMPPTARRTRFIAVASSIALERGYTGAKTAADADEYVYHRSCDRADGGANIRQIDGQMGRWIIGQTDAQTASHTSHTHTPGDAKCTRENNN